MIERIVSGGQTGVDQAGLFIALQVGIKIGGWCPKGGLDENDQNILQTYPCLKEAETSNPDERTRLNIRHSDGTLIIVPVLPLPHTIRDGTRLTIEDAERQNKPFLVISLATKENPIQKIHEWVLRNNIKILNVAGPRESSSPGIHNNACSLFQELFTALKSNQSYQSRPFL